MLLARTDQQLPSFSPAHFAAGDVFVGGFVASLAAGRSVADAVGFGQAAASLSVTRHGAQPSIPRLDEIIRQDA